MFLNSMPLARRVAMPFRAMTNLDPSMCVLGHKQVAFAGRRQKSKTAYAIKSVSYYEHLISKH